jgi:ABC-2 type transport system ATP-binding protein
MHAYGSGSGDAIVAEDLRKRFGPAVGLDGFSIRVAPGTVCGLLGPNGAGKTTAVRILTTLLRADTGRASVAGHDVGQRPAEVRASIGLVGQHAAVDEVLSGRQNLELFGRLSHLSRRQARARASALLSRMGLDEAAERPAKDYSGGMRRRLDLAAGLILHPPVLFLDEPTTGLDPRGRAEVWAAVRGLVADGTTVLLTTQYLEEADQLAGRVAIVDAGRVIAEGSPDDLKRRLGGDRLQIVVRDAAAIPAAVAIVQRAAGAAAEVTVDPDRRRISVPARDRASALTETARALEEAGVVVEDIGLRRPTLDEVFLALTGTGIGAGSGAKAGAGASAATGATEMEAAA